MAKSNDTTSEIMVGCSSATLMLINLAMNITTFVYCITHW